MNRFRGTALPIALTQATTSERSLKVYVHYALMEWKCKITSFGRKGVYQIQGVAV